MLQLAKWVRGCFGIQAVLMGVTLALYAYTLIRVSLVRGLTPQEFGRFGVRGAILFAVALLVLGATYGMAWWTLRNGKPYARTWAIAASLLSLGTVGIPGLIVFWRKDVVAQIATGAFPAPPRIPGDGTSKILENITMAIQVALLLVAMHWWDKWAAAQGLRPASGLRWWVQFELALQASILFHELGHVFGGWLTDMKLRHLVVGPFEARVRSGKWAFKFNVAGLVGAGQTGMVPVTLKDLRGRSVFLTIAGPVASLLTGSVAMVAALSAKGHPWQPLWEFFAILATLGLSQFVTNLIPLRPEDQYSDGAQIYQLVSGGPWADLHMAFAMVGSTLVTPLRFRDLETAVIRRAAGFLREGKQALLLRLFLYMHFLDSGRMPEALQALAEAEAVYPGVAQTLEADLHLEFVFANALLRRDPHAARMWWDRMKAKGAPEFKVDSWKARTALMWIEGRSLEAREAWKSGNALVQKLPPTGGYEFDRWSFDRLREALDAPANAAPPQQEAALTLG